MSQTDLIIHDEKDNVAVVIDKTSNGRLTCAEALGHREFIITKLYRSA
jgi:(2R)-sulfolactate sulfo-lyase subunit beta